MAIENIKVGIEVSSNGTTEKETKQAKALKAAFDEAAVSAAKLGGTAGSRAVAAKAMPVGSQTMRGEDYRTARGIAEATGASSRDFAKQAQGLGGLVHVYATFAANLFAVGAAFTALKNAADTTNMIKGMDQLGARSGIALGNLSKRVSELTDNAVSLREAMTATVQATSAGMTSQNLERLATVAKKAGDALGIGAAEALNRLSRGITKIEPELLDELGIFVRVDTAVNDYAISVGKAASSLTDFERRQAFALAVLKQGEDKFSNIQIDANPYQKLLATIQNVAQEVLSVVNTVLGPVAKYLAESPSLVLAVLTSVTGYLIKQAIPAIQQYSKTIQESIDKENNAIKSLQENRLGAYEAQKKQLADLAQKNLEATAAANEAAIDAASKAEKAVLSAKSKYAASVKNILSGAETYQDITPEQLSIIDKLGEKQTKVGASYKELAERIRAAQAAHDLETLAIEKSVLATKALTTATKEEILAKKALEKANTDLAISQAKLDAAKMFDQKGLLAGFSTLLQGLSNIQGNWLSKLKAGFSGAAGLVGAQFSKLLGLVNPVIASVTAAITVWQIADGIFSENAKSVSKLNSSLDSLEESIASANRTALTFNELDISKVAPLEKLKASTNAIQELGTNFAKVVADLRSADTASNAWDKFWDGFLVPIGKDLKSKTAKQLSLSIVEAIALAQEGPAKEEFVKKIEDITGLKNVNLKSLNELFDSLTPEQYISTIERGDKAFKVFQQSTSVATAKVTELDNAFDATQKSFDAFAASMQNTSPLSTFANNLVVQAQKITTALEEPAKAFENLVKLSKDPKKLSILDQNTLAALQQAQPVIEQINKSLEQAKKEFAIREKEKLEGRGNWETAALMKQAKDQIDSLSKQAANMAKYFLETIQADGFKKAAQIYGKEIIAAQEEASIAIAKARTGLLTDEVAVKEQGRLTELQIQSNIRLVNSNMELIKAHYMTIAQLKEDSANRILSDKTIVDTDKLDAARQAKTEAIIQKSLLTTKNAFDLYSTIQKGGDKLGIKAANEIFPQLQNLAGFTKELIKLEGQLQANRISTQTSALVARQGRESKDLEVSLKLKQSELERLQTLRQLVGYADEDTILREKLLADTIAQERSEKAIADLREKQKAVSNEQQKAIYGTQIKQAQDTAKSDAVKREMEYGKILYDMSLVRAKREAEADSDKLTTLISEKRLSKEISDLRLTTLLQSEAVSEKTKADLIFERDIAAALLDYEEKRGRAKIAQAEKFAEFEAKKGYLAAAPLEQGETQVAREAAQKEVQKQEDKYIAEQGAYNARLLAEKDTLLLKAKITKEISLEQAKYNDLLKSASNISDSLKAAFDGVAESTKNVANALGGVVTALATFAVNSQKGAKALEDLKEEQKRYEEGKAGSKDRSKDIALQEKQNRIDEVRGYAQVAGAAKSMFKEKTAAYKAFAIIERAMHLASLAMNVQKMLSDKTSLASKIATNVAGIASDVAATGVSAVKAVVGAIASMPFPINLVAGAATAAVVYSLLSSIGGKGGPAVSGAGAMAENQGKGTTFGNKDEASKSLTESISILKETDPILMRNSMGMLKHLRSIDTNIAQLGVTLIKSLPGGGDIATEKFNIQQGMVGISPDLLGRFIPILNNLAKALGFGTKTSVKGQGILAGPQTLQQIEQQGFQGSYYADVRTERKALGITYSSRSRTDLAALDDALAQQLGLIFKSAGNAILDASSMLGESTDKIAEKLNGFVINIGKINLQGLSAEDQQKRFEAVVGAELDKMTMAVYPQVYEFIKIGEGAATTLTRLISGIEGAKVALDLLGISAISYTDIINKQGDVAAEIVRQSILVQETQSLIQDVITTADGTAQDIIELYTQLDKLRDTILTLGISQSFLSREVIMAAGGTDKFTDSLSTFYDKFTTDAYKASVEAAKVNYVFGKLNLEVPKTRVELTNMLVSLSKTAPKSAGAILGIIESLDSMYTTMEKSTDSLDTVVTKFRGFAKSLIEFKDSLLLGTTSILTPMEKLIQAQKEYDTISAKALAGDEEAINKLQSTSQTYLGLARDVYASSQQYTDIFTSVLGTLDMVSISASAKADVAQLQLDAQNASVLLLTSINENIAIIANMPTAASGGRVSGLTLVGEKGPEIVDFSTPGRVYTAEQTAGMFVPVQGMSQQQLIAEIRTLKEEVVKLREQQNTETGHIINATYDAQNRNAEQVTEGVSSSISNQAWASKVSQNALIS